MGAVTDALARAATAAGAEIITVGRRERDPRRRRRRRGRLARRRHPAHGRGRHVLSNVAPWVLRILLGEPEDPAPKPEGAQLKINLLLDRLPRLRSGRRPGRRVLRDPPPRARTTPSSRRRTPTPRRAGCPSVMPGEVYCHSLTDPSILGAAPEGTHTLTYFGLHTPASLFPADPAGAKALAVRAPWPPSTSTSSSRSRSASPATPPASCASRPRSRRTSRPTSRCPAGTSSTATSTGPGRRTARRLDSPAQQLGCRRPTTASVLLCGSGSRRGGAVSGLGGHNAAQAVLSARAGLSPLDFPAPAAAGKSRCRFTARCAISSIGRAADS